MARVVQGLLLAAVGICTAVALFLNWYSAQFLAGDNTTLKIVYTGLVVGSGLVKLCGAVYLEYETKIFKRGLFWTCVAALLIDVYWSIGFGALSREQATGPRAEAARAYRDAETKALGAKADLDLKKRPDKAAAVLEAELTAARAGALKTYSERESGFCAAKRDYVDECQAVAKLAPALASARDYETAAAAHKAAVEALGKLELPKAADPQAHAIGEMLRKLPFLASFPDEAAGMGLGLLLVLFFEGVAIFVFRAATKPPRIPDWGSSRTDTSPAQKATGGTQVPARAPVARRKRGAVPPDISALLKALATGGNLPSGLAVTTTGGLFGSQRALATAAGLSASSINTALREAQAAGRLTYIAGAGGTRIEFATVRARA